MSEWLSVLTPLTVAVTFLLLSRYFFAHKLSASHRYSMWLLVPVAVIAHWLPLPWSVETIGQQNSLLTFVVQPGEHLSDSGMGYVFWLWFVPALALFVNWCVRDWLQHGQMGLHTVNVEVLPCPIPSGVSVAQSQNNSGPLLTGILRPTLVLPRDFSSVFCSAQQKMVIEHELTHYRRNDLLWNALALGLLALCWFHPLMWLAYAAFRQDQEMSCDSAIVSDLPKQQKVLYGRALVLSAQFNAAPVTTVLSLNHQGEKNDMIQRIQNLKSMVHTDQSRHKFVLGCAATIAMSSLFIGNLSVASTDNVAKAEKAEHVYPITRFEPVYPEVAAKQGVEGSVVLKFDVLEKGTVGNIEVIKSKPEGVFDLAASQALSSWTYTSTGSVSRNHLVQLDFVLDADTPHEDMLEKIKVKK